MNFDRMFFVHLSLIKIDYRKAAVVAFSCMLMLYGCAGGSPVDEEADSTTVREVLAESNKLMIAAEDQDIRDFISRYGWEMEASGSGLRYAWVEKGEGKQARKGLWATINYRIYLLTGDLLYASDEDGPKRFIIGEGGVESGLEEGILMMHEGDKMRLILPAHLAHGLPGDGVKIPPRAGIVYEVELLKLTE